MIFFVEWILRNSQPSMGELTFTSAAGEVYATQFFSAKKLKFILILRPDDLAVIYIYTYIHTYKYYMF